MDTQLSIAVVRPEHIQALQHIVSTEETRYYLCGVLIEPHKDGGAVMTATDGHILATVYDPNAFCAGTPQIWRYKDYAAAVKAFLTRQSKTVRNQFWLRYQQFESAKPDFRIGMAMGSDGAEAANLTWDNGLVCEQIGRDCAIDGTFPEYSRIHHSIGTDRSDACIASGLLIRLGKFAEALDGSNVNLIIKGKRDPAPFFIDVENVRVAGVVMPFGGIYREHHDNWLADHINRDDLRAPAPAEINTAKAA